MRANTDVAAPLEKEEKKAGEAASKLRIAAKANKVKKDAWEQQVTQAIMDGNTRRGHLQTLLSVECLRDVGYKVAELLATDFVLEELREGLFTAAECRATGIKAFDMASAGYTARELRGGGYSASALKKSTSFTAAQLKAGGFTAKQLKAAEYEPLELKENGFTATELKEGTFTAGNLKPFFTCSEVSDVRLIAV